MSVSSLNDPAAGGRGTSKLLISSYVIDWVLILATGATGRILNFAEPNRNPFSLNDPSISYPFAEHETVPSSTLILVGLMAPAVIILLVSLLLAPGPKTDKYAPAALVWRRRLWEWNVGWMGLGIAYAGVYATTEALKVIYGKPRPDLLSRCNPDVDDILPHAVGGLGKVLRGAPILVKWTICQNRTEELMRDGFVSFPSGHASSSFAGLTYLTLWLCSKFSISFPYLAPRLFSRNTEPTTFSTTPLDEESPHHHTHSPSPTPHPPLRSQSAAAPTYLVLLAAAPIVAATYIASSRWFDNRHHGFDILFGALLGVFFAYLGFRWYHVPLSAGGAGWAWGARSAERAFFAGVGRSGFVGVDGAGVDDGRRNVKTTAMSSRALGGGEGGSMSGLVSRAEGSA
ncbi:hypothetical protein FQN55_005974 [Onygenales sp. PD_40]|nr:hypothetical protein FQN55_005974 [Onygenales sp. PD_40]